MRLISQNGHDYYDCMARYDEDRTVIFNRKTSIKIRQDKYQMYGQHLSDYEVYSMHGVMWVGFCGKLYMGLNIYKDKVLVDILWDKNKINQRFRWRQENSKYKWRRKQQPQTYDALVDKYKKVYPPEEEAIWASVQPKEVIINPCLKDYWFYTIMPPQQAWIELSNWYNNIARPLRPIPEIDDKTLCEAKGFSAKHSFRKEKSK